MTQVITTHRSPNFDERPSGALIDLIVMHATASHDTDGDIRWLCRPHGDSSSHVVIDRDGTIYDLIDVKHRAWHAGRSAFEGRTDGHNSVNGFSVGVELANSNRGEKYPDAQLAAAAAYCAGLIREWPAITVERITTHAAVALPAGRKDDPAPPFDLQAFKQLVQEELDR